MDSSWSDKAADAMISVLDDHYEALQAHEDAVQAQPYDVTAWVTYLDAVEDLLLQAKQQQAKQQPQPTTAAATTASGQPAEELELLYKFRDWIGRRALQLLPGSFKLWKLQWEFHVARCQRLQLLSNSAKGAPAGGTVANELYQQAVDTTIDCFERAIVTLHAFPRVWKDYLEFLNKLPAPLLPKALTFVNQDSYSSVSVYTTLRRLVNRALQAVALTQHDKIWPCILQLLQLEEDEAAAAEKKSATDDDENLLHWPVETQVRLLQRYTQLYPNQVDKLAQFCERHEQWGQAAATYQRLFNTAAAENNSDPTIKSQAWQSFVDVCSRHSQAVEDDAGIPWQDIFSSHVEQTKRQSRLTGQTQPQQQEEEIWTRWAAAWIRRGEFGLARTIYEQGLQQVNSVADFVVIYNAYLQLEQGLLESMTQAVEQAGIDDDEMDETNDDDVENKDKDDDWDLLLGGGGATKATTNSNSSQVLADMELALARAEHLADRRPLLLNSVVLRQSPNNVGEWLHRADLYVDQLKQPGQAVAALEESLKTVQASKAVNGSPSQLVTKLAEIHVKDRKAPNDARNLLDRICNQGEYRFVRAEDLAECWSAWIELELALEQWDDALRLARQSVAPSPPVDKSSNKKRQLNLTKSLRLWDLLLDLEESLGTVQTTKDAYTRALEIKAATVQHVLNFASFLTEHNYFEESFAAYERGLELFAFPHAGAKLLWKSYLEAFLNRYKGTKVERARDLFERCLETCPPEESAEFYVKNGDFEEQYGLTKRALSVYRTMCLKVPASEQFSAYQLLVAKTTKYLGVTATRDIYQEAVENLKDIPAAKMCAEFAKMETGLEQIDRARGVFTYGAQMADPRRLPEYWKTWNEFEISHGNEDTFREMLRVKRSVEAAFSTVNYNATGMTDKVENLTNEEAMQQIANQEGVELGPNRTAVSGFVPSSKRTAAAASLDDVEERVAKLRKATAVSEEVAETAQNDDEHGADVDEDEIDIEDIDAEIEEAAAEGAAAAVQDVSTKSVPASVFGELASDSNK